MKIISLAAGVAVGYVLGTRAGRDKYEQIVGGVRKLTATSRATPSPATALPPEIGLSLDDTRSETGLPLGGEPPVTTARPQPRPRKTTPIAPGQQGIPVV